jgi:hypothetical protein
MPSNAWARESRKVEPEARPKSRRRSFGAHAAHLRVQRLSCSLTHARCARSAAHRFTRIWATWIAESLAEGFRPRLSGLPAREWGSASPVPSGPPTGWARRWAEVAAIPRGAQGTPAWATPSAPADAAGLGRPRVAALGAAVALGLAAGSGSPPRRARPPRWSRRRRRSIQPGWGCPSSRLRRAQPGWRWPAQAARVRSATA